MKNREKNWSAIGGPNITVEGDVHFTANTVIGGCVTGDVVGEGVDATIFVEGTIVGTINNEDGTVHLSKTAVVNGDIICKTLVVDEGARINGHIEVVSSKGDFLKEQKE